jgi:hypothetical protein
MADGFASSMAAVSTTFANGVSAPPQPAGTFTPTAGSSPGQGQPFVLAAVGDAANGKPNNTAVSNLIASWNPNLFLYLGDVYDKGSYAEFTNMYEGTFGRFRLVCVRLSGRVFGADP